MRSIFLCLFLLACLVPATTAQTVFVTPSVYLTDVVDAPFAAELEVLALGGETTSYGVSVAGSFLGGVPVEDSYAVFVTPLVLRPVGRAYVAGGPGAVLYKELSGEPDVAFGLSAEVGVLVPIGDAAIISSVRVQFYETETPDFFGNVVGRLGVSVPLTP